MYGAAFLRITESDDASVDSILSAIKAAGKNAVIDSYNGIQRDARLAYLTGAFGDVTAAIQEAVDSMVANGFDATEARDLVLGQARKGRTESLILSSVRFDGRMSARVSGLFHSCQSIPRINPASGRQ